VTDGKLDSSHDKEKLPGGSAGMNIDMRLRGVPKRVTPTDIYLQLTGTNPLKKLLIGGCD
jgi:hypothetical protein